MADLGYPTTVNSSTLSKLVRMVGLTILKNMKVTGKDYPIYIMENKKCLKTTNQ